MTLSDKISGKIREQNPSEGGLTEVVAAPVEQTDHDLVLQFQQGGAGAFDKLVGRHQQKVISMACQYLHRYEDACEVAQDVFVKVYFALPEFRGESDFSTWLYRITRNATINHWRKMQVRHVQETQSLDAIPGQYEKISEENNSAASTPDGQAVARERDRQLKKAMGELPEKYREVLIFREVQQLSYEQTAAVLKCQIGTVKSRLARARDELRKRLGEEWFE